VTVEQVLLEAAEKIGTRFSDRPLVEAGIRDTIGRAFESLNRNELAAENLQIADNIRRAQGIGNHPEYLVSRAELAIALHTNGKFEESRKLFHEVVDEAERQLKQSDRDIVPAVDVLARTSTYIAVPVERLRPLFKTASERRQALLGEDHADTLLCRVMYGVYVADVDAKQTEAIFRDALQRMQRVLGPADRYTLRTQDKLATLLFNLGRKEESLSLSLDAAQIAESTYGFEHPLALLAWHDHADMLSKNQRYSEALAIQQRRTEAMRALYGPESTPAVHSLVELASLHARMGNQTEALRITRERVELSRKVFGPKAMNTVFAEGTLAEAYWRNGKAAEALVVFDESMPEMRKQLRREMPRFIELKETYARALHAAGREEEAVTLAQEILEIVDPLWPQATQRISKLQLAQRTSASAMILARVKGPVESEQTLRLALDRCRAAGATPGRVVRELTEQLAICCERTGRREEAAELRDELSRIDAAINERAATQPLTASRHGGEASTDTPD
jgi:tetratricopeptide (TPR) repeat protein